MTKTVKQKLVAQIDWLQSILQEYKKAQVNLPAGMNTQTLADTIEQIEAEISDLQIKLEVMVAIALFYSPSQVPTNILTEELLSA
ncbi:MAG TPA: hypothetical protein DCE56_39575 [Cyanobacteria bacterium UBA8553]|nr:hypothetical protein [Cyanobacteria bacterium UBA8553]HAJ60404.1 hypothetical protein [Cyanobacteria bacterium UBA8543]